MIIKNISCVDTTRHYLDQYNCKFDLINIFDDRWKLEVCSYYVDVIKTLIKYVIINKLNVQNCNE